MYVWDSCTGNFISKFKKLHQLDAQAVDLHGDIIVSGSRDHTVKVWH